MKANTLEKYQEFEPFVQRWTEALTSISETSDKIAVKDPQIFAPGDMFMAAFELRFVGDTILRPEQISVVSIEGNTLTIERGENPQVIEAGMDLRVFK